MKQKMLSFLIILLAVSCLCGQQDSLPEQYVGKIFIEAKWGDGPGEFKLKQTVHGPSGVGSLVIDPNGNIYIPDQDGIKKFDNNGKYSSDIPLLGIKGIEAYGVDAKGNVYVPMVIHSAKTPDSLGMRFIKQFSPTGELLKTHRIIVNMSSSLYGYTASNIGLFPEVVNGEIVLPKGDKEFVIGRVDRQYNKGEQKMRERTSKINYQIIREDENGYIIKSKIGKSQSQSKRIEAVDQIMIHGGWAYPEICIGIDAEGNGYVFTSVKANRSKKYDDFEIWKFNTKGVLLARITIGSQEHCFTEWLGYRREIVDMQGNIYSLLTSKDWVRVYKYEKVVGK